MKRPTLLVLAAGMGSRYGGLKQLDPLGPGGETIIDYSVFDAVRAGFGRLVFVIRPDFEDDFRRVVGDKYRGVVEVAYAHQRLDDLPADFAVPEGRVKPWGTAHAILSAREVVAEPFAVINADDFYGAASFRVLAARLAAADFAALSGLERYAMVGFTLRNTLSEHGSVSRGVCRVDKAGGLLGVEEIVDIATDTTGVISGVNGDGAKVTLAGDETVSMNMWGFPPGLFPRLATGFAAFLAEHGAEMKSEYFIPAVVNDAARRGEAVVEVLPSAASWFGVTYREDRPMVVESIRRLVDSGEYPARLFG